MFINKKRIDDDLEIFQRSFFNSEPTERGLGKESAYDKESRLDDAQEKFTFSDFISLCGAAFFVILPWALTFAVLLAFAGWLLTLWLS